MTKNKYRVSNILKVTGITEDAILKFDTEDTKEGLAIEMSRDKGKSYFVIAFIRYDAHEESCEIEGVGLRLTNVPGDDWPTVKKLIVEASDRVIEANK